MSEQLGTLPPRRSGGENSSLSPTAVRIILRHWQAGIRFNTDWRIRPYFYRTQENETTKITKNTKHKAREKACQDWLPLFLFVLLVYFVVKIFCYYVGT